MPEDALCIIGCNVYIMSTLCTHVHKRISLTKHLIKRSLSLFPRPVSAFFSSLGRPTLPCILRYTPRAVLLDIKRVNTSYQTEPSIFTPVCSLTSHNHKRRHTVNSQLQIVAKSGLGVTKLWSRSQLKKKLLFKCNSLARAITKTYYFTLILWQLILTPMAT